MGESLGMGIVAPPLERTFESLMLDFLAYLEFERGLSRNTLEAYRGDLLQFGRFLEERKTAITDVQGAHVAEFLSQLAGGGGRGRHLRPPCIARLHACARSSATCGART